MWGQKEIINVRQAEQYIRQFRGICPGVTVVDNNESLYVEDSVISRLPSTLDIILKDVLFLCPVVFPRTQIMARRVLMDGAVFANGFIASDAGFVKRISMINATFMRSLDMTGVRAPSVDLRGATFVRLNPVFANARVRYLNIQGVTGDYRLSKSAIIGNLHR